MRCARARTHAHKYEAHHFTHTTRSQVGAKLIHSLLVANNERSINLALQLIEDHPPLLLGTHGQEAGEAKPVFSGEGAMHIVAVNKQRTAVEAMVRTAVKCLTPAQVEEVLTQTCTGVFFKGAPMRYFGGSVMAYLCVFGHLIPVLPLLQSLPDGLVLRTLECRGRRYFKYTPLHATVMAGRVPEFDVLIEYGCNEFAEDADGFTPMRLAVKMGMRDVFLHSLRHRIKTEWVWGPIAAYKLPLKGLDTEGIAGEQSVMDLVADDMAVASTKAMLLDSFMNGACLAPQTQCMGARIDPAFPRCQVSSSTFSSKSGIGAPAQAQLPPPLLNRRRHLFALAPHLPPQVGPLRLGLPVCNGLVAGLQRHIAGVAINYGSIRG